MKIDFFLSNLSSAAGPIQTDTPIVLRLFAASSLRGAPVRRFLGTIMAGTQIKLWEVVCLCVCTTEGSGVYSPEFPAVASEGAPDQRDSLCC